MQSLFEGAMYIFVLQWPPALTALARGRPVPFGKVNFFLIFFLFQLLFFVRTPVAPCPQGATPARGRPVPFGKVIFNFFLFFVLFFMCFLPFLFLLCSLASCPLHTCLSLSHTHTHPLSLSLSHSLTHSLSHSLILSLSLRSPCALRHAFCLFHFICSFLRFPFFALF